MFQAIKYFFLFLLTFLLEVSNAYAKTEFVLPQVQVYFSVEQNQSFKSLEKEVQPNIGFLKEKVRFVESKSVSAQNQQEFSECYSCEVANGVVRQNWNGYAKIFKATTEEIADATKRIANHRTTTGNLSGGNYGYIEGVVNGNILDNKMWRSGQADLMLEPQIFDAIPVTGGNGGTWLRNTDSEYKMLNKLADDLGGVKNNSYPNVTGEFKIVSENPYCASCQGIIQQFHDMFPNVNLILVDGAK